MASPHDFIDRRASGGEGAMLLYGAPIEPPLRRIAKPPQRLFAKPPLRLFDFSGRATVVSQSLQGPCREETSTCD
jgi:hypothetical protein